MTRKLVPFFGGLPWAIDVKKLDERYGVPERGTLIPHEEIAACIGYPWKSIRYRGVLDAWRRKLRGEFNLATTVEPGRGLYFLMPPEQIVEGKAQSRRGMRKFRRGGVLTASTPNEGLTEQQREERDRAAQMAFRIYSSAVHDLKSLEPPRPSAALPRIAAP